MNEFIDNFNEFKEFLNHKMFNNIKDGKYQGDIWKAYDDIKNKFEELGLTEVF